MKVLVPAFRDGYIKGDSLDPSKPLVWMIDDVLSPAECTATIAKIEELGPEAAPITTAAGFVMRPDVRNNDRVIFDMDPGEGVPFARVIEAALVTKALLQELGLKSWLKTSGGNGLRHHLRQSERRRRARVSCRAERPRPICRRRLGALVLAELFDAQPPTVSR